MKSKTFAKIVACLLVMLISLSAVSAAVAPSTQAPAIPAQFHGTLYNNEGKPFPAGTVITAEVNGITSTFILVEDGKIGGSGIFDDKFLISGVENGDTITFRVKGTDVIKTFVYDEHSSPENGGVLSLVMDAAIPTPSSGGNGGSGFVPSSSAQTGATATQSVTSTVTETVVAATATALPTEAAKTPLGVAGMLLGGLAVAAVVLRRR